MIPFSGAAGSPTIKPHSPSSAAPANRHGERRGHVVVLPVADDHRLARREASPLQTRSEQSDRIELSAPVQNRRCVIIAIASIKRFDLADCLWEGNAYVAVSLSAAVEGFGVREPRR